MLATRRSIGESANFLCGKVLLVIRALELYSGWVNKDLILSFVHDRWMTIWASYLAGQLMSGGFLHTIIPGKIVVAVGEIYIFLFKRSCPSKRCTLKLSALFNKLSSRSCLQCRAWHVVQWQYLASRGFVCLMWNWILPQWQPPSKRDLKESASWILYGARNLHWFSSPSDCSFWPRSWPLVFWAIFSL
jgi:hypothetical protein